MIGLTGCVTDTPSGPGGKSRDNRTEFLKGNKTEVLKLGSLVSISGDTYNITESKSTSIGYRPRAN